MKATVLSSSIIHHTMRCPGGVPTDWNLWSLPGATVPKLINLLQQKKQQLQIDRYGEVVAIHVGGNDLSNGRTVREVITEYRLLLQLVCLYLKPQAILVCTVLPRIDLDGGCTGGVVRELNAALAELVAETPELLKLVRLHRVVTNFGMPNSKLYYQKDCIHLDLGLPKLRKYLQGAIDHYWAL